MRQQVIATLGRFEDLQASGQLERLVRSGARFAAKAMVLSAASNEAAIKIGVRRIGPALVFERPWEETTASGLARRNSGARDLIHPIAVDLLRGEFQLQAFTHHAGKKAAHRVRLPAGGLHHRRNRCPRRGL
ncbi:MAG TPA: hypothetical protein VNZ53_18995 [Steroidobacteraceae bacterium]|nr:hypothetical protein [Steroidobacteraceae bacterium]